MRRLTTFIETSEFTREDFDYLLKRGKNRKPNPCVKAVIFTGKSNYMEEVQNYVKQRADDKGHRDDGS